MKLKEINYFGFNHQEIYKKFGGELEFICEMSLPIMTGNGPLPIPCAVYKAHNPDRSKGHKDYMLLFSQGDKYFVSGRSEEEMAPNWVCNGVHCKSCGEVLISIDRHHFNQCNCENGTFLDGGGYYSRIGGMDMGQIESVEINLKTKQIKVLT